MTRTTGLKRPPQIHTSFGPDPPAHPRSGRSHTPVTGRKGPPAQYTPQIVTIDDDEDEDEDEDEEEEDESDDQDEESEEGSGGEEDSSEEEEGFVRPAIDDSEEFSKRQLELIQLASDLSANDDLLSCIFVDTFGSMTAKDDLGVYYHQGDFMKPYFNRAEVVKMAQETIVHGNVQAALDRSLRLAVFRNRISVLRSNSQIKKFVAHLKRYLMLYHPSSRVEIRTTDRYRFATQKSELAVHATVDLDPGMTEYVQMDLRNVVGNSAAATPQDGTNWATLNGIPNQLNGRRMAAELEAQGITDWGLVSKPPMLVLDEITGAMEVMPKTWEERLSGNNIEDDPDGKNGVTSAQRRLQARNVPYGDMGINGDGEADQGTSGPVKASSRSADGRQKMAEIRDFSVVNSGRQGLMLFLGPGRFINHDCSPNVELITTKRNVITFRVLRRIRTGDELTTWYGDNYFGPGNRDCLCLTCELAHRGGFTRVVDNGAIASHNNTVPKLGSNSKRTSDAVRRSAGQVTPSTSTSDGALDPGMLITVTDEGMVSPDGSMVDGDENESLGGKDVDMDEDQDEDKRDSTDDITEDADKRRRSARRSNAFSSVPHHMTDSLSISTSARASPESSVAGSSPTRESARNKRRAAARGRERTSNMIQHPFGYSKVNGKGGFPSSNADGHGYEGAGESTQPHSERDEPGTLRCTVCLSVMEPVWVSNRYVEQCRRCIRHKAIYGSKWPARAKAEEQPYPPVNMRPSWWVPPKISRHRFRSVTPSVIETNNFDDGQQMSDGGREANAQEQEARREVKRLHRWEVLQAEAAAKFRKDLEVAQDLMRRMEKEHAAEKEAARTKPRQHNGGGNWGKYEYVWEEEEQPVVLEEGSKRNRRAPAHPESQPPAPKRRKTDESAGESTRSHRRKPETKQGTQSKREEKSHPASRRNQRPKSKGPFFSAMPASPTAEIMPVEDFDIMPLTTDPNATTRQAPIALTDGDSYDSDVEVIATNVARARAAQGGLEEDYGSNVNPISLSAEEDQADGNTNGNGNGNGKGNESSDEDIFYSSHFSASALHYLMPSVTDGSVNTGGVPKGTTDGQSTGTGSSRAQPSATKGISPLKHREVFRGTLSSPDVHLGVRPESYKQPKALTERGKGTRAALEAQEREGSRSGNPPPLLHSAEAEIARARQAAAFMESARRKPTRKTQVSRISKPWHPSPSPTSSGKGRRDEDGADRGDKGEDCLQEMLDTILSSQLMSVDDINNADSTGVSARSPIQETGPREFSQPSVPLEQTIGKASEDNADSSPHELGIGVVSPLQQETLGAGHPAGTAITAADLRMHLDTTARNKDSSSEMVVTCEDGQQTTSEVPAIISSRLSTEKEDIVEVVAGEEDIAEVMVYKEDLPEETVATVVSSDDQQVLNTEGDARMKEVAVQSSMEQASALVQPDVVVQSTIPSEVAPEADQYSSSDIKGQEHAIKQLPEDTSAGQSVPTTPEDHNSTAESDLFGRPATGEELNQDIISPTELVSPQHPDPSSDAQSVEQTTALNRVESAYRYSPAKMPIDDTATSSSIAYPNDNMSAANNSSGGPEAEEHTPPVANISTVPIVGAQPLLPLDTTTTPAPTSDQHVEDVNASSPELHMASPPRESSAMAPSCAVEDEGSTDGVESPHADANLATETDNIGIDTNIKSDDHPSATTTDMEPVMEEESHASMEVDTLARDDLPTLTPSSPQLDTQEETVTIMETDTKTSLAVDDPLPTITIPEEPVAQESLPVVRDTMPLEADFDRNASCGGVASLVNEDAVRVANQTHQNASSSEVAAPNQTDSDSAALVDQVTQGISDVIPSTAVQKDDEAETLNTEREMDPPEPLMESGFPSMDALPSLEAEPPLDEMAEQPAQINSIAESPRLQTQPHASMSTPSRPSSTITQSSTTSKKRRRGGNAPIPKDATFVVLSSDDDVEIIPPPKKVVLRAPTGSSALPSPHPMRTPGSQTRHSSTSINPTSLGTPMSQRISVISSPAVPRSSRVPNTASPSTSATAHVSAPTVTPDTRRGSQKGALFLPSTKKALESRRTIEALRRIQLAAAGRTEHSEDEPPEPLAVDTSATGVDTSWQPESSDNAGVGTAWDTPAALPAFGESSESNANTGWGSEAVPTGNSSGWGASVETTSASDPINPQTSAGSNADSGWNAQPAAKPSGNDGWNTATAVTSSTNDGWDTQPTINPNIGNAWTTSGTSVNEPSASSASPVVLPETASTGWGDAPNSGPPMNVNFDVSTQGTVKVSDAWNSSSAPVQSSSNGWSQAPPQEPSTNTSWGDNAQSNTDTSKNNSWGDTIQSTLIDDGWGASTVTTSTPTQAWVTQQKADAAVSARSASFPHEQPAPEPSPLDKPTSTTVDPNAWEPEPEPETAKAATDWSVWHTPVDTPSLDIPSNGWGEPPARQNLNSWDAPSRNSVRRDPGLSVDISTNGAHASAFVQNGWDVPASALTSRNDDRSSAALPTKPRRQTAEDFWQHNDSPNPKSAHTSNGGYGGSTFGGAPRRGPGVKVLLKGVGSDVSWQDLKDFGRAAGRPLRADVDRATGDGFIEYGTREEAQTAVETLSVMEFRGRRPEVTCETFAPAPAPVPKEPVTSPAKNASAGWGAWEPSDTSGKPQDDGWGNVTATAPVSGWSTGGGWGADPPTEGAGMFSRFGNRSRPASRPLSQLASARPAEQRTRSPDRNERRDAERSTRHVSRASSRRGYERSRSRDTRRDNDTDGRKSRRLYDEPASERRSQHRHSERQRSERGESESRHASRRGSERRHSQERRSERSERRHSERREGDGYERRSERRERHRSRSPERVSERGRERSRGADRDAYDYDWRRAHLSEDRTEMKPDRRDLDERHSGRHSARRETRRRESRHEDIEKRPAERPSLDETVDGRRYSETRVPNKIHPSRLANAAPQTERRHGRRQSAGAASDPEPGQLIDDPKYPEVVTTTNAMPLGRKMRVFGKASADNAPRDPPSGSTQQPTFVQPEKPHANEADAVRDKTSGLNSSDSAATQTTSSHGWGEPTAAASTAEQGSGWDAWGSSSATNIPQVNAGW